MTTRRIIITSLICLVVVVFVAVAWPLVRPHNQTPSAVASLVDGATLGRLPTADSSGLDRSHVTPGLAAPTNKWFSGLALNKVPQPVFPLPASFLASETGFHVGLPQVKATADTISGAYAAGISASIANASDYQVTRYDEVSVDLTYRDSSGQPLGTLTLAAGSPYVFFAATSPTTITTTVTNPQTDGDKIRGASNGASYFFAVNGGASQKQSASLVTQTIPAGGLATYYALPVGQSDVLGQYAANRLAKADVSYSVDDRNATTTIRYHTANDQPTAVAALPHQAVTQTVAAHYSSIYGDMKLVTGTNQLAFAVPRVTAKRQLDVGGLDSAQKSELTQQLVRDSQQLNFVSDSYAGGKAVYRAAQLLDLAKQLGATETAQQLQQKLGLELLAWFRPDISAETPRSFYYDSAVQGIVGVTPSFGSEQFNDHNFHYGYFIYAASILARYDNQFVKKHGAMVNLLVADIANYDSGQDLPLRRVFDPYASHSWASGGSPFADGNNQESSSEAINAWAATSLWADATHNQHLADEASWLLSSETKSANAYWLAAPSQPGYQHTIASLNWGGKRDYATFFSAAPAAKLGIQLIPMSPTQADLSSGSVAAQLAEAVPDGNYNVPLGDYLLMYKGLVDPKAALDKASTLTDQYIDSANSRTYLLAWLMALQ